MKRIKIISAVLSLMIIFAACGKSDKTNDSIYDKIHGMFYDIKSYSTNCEITTFTKGGESTYACRVAYDSQLDSYTVTSDDMKMHLTKDKTVITKGSNTIESPSVDGDMYIFINTFFKSYYESEDTALSVGAKEESRLHMLECSAINPTDYIASMKLWVDAQSAMPQKMQVIASDESISCEVNFLDFKFTK